MGNSDIVSFKIYLLDKNTEEPEIRRFGLQASLVTNYVLLVERIIEVFPVLSGKEFKIFWKDEENDEVAISSNEELLIALMSIKTDLKKFYVKVQPSKNKSSENVEMHSVTHPGVFCDVCENSITGFRFKCLVCRDYDLCSDCEQTGTHFDHPMLRISDPLAFNYIHFRKLISLMHSFVPDLKYHRRRHSGEGGHPDSCKKKKKCDKRESGHETGDESEDGCHSKKYSYKRCKKNKYFLMNDFMNYIDPVNFSPLTPQNGDNDETERIKENYLSYFQNVGSTIQKLLNPLGVNVEIEVRGNQNEKNRKESTEPKPEEKKNETTKTPSPTPSTSNPKEVRFGINMTEQINEITKKLANQNMNNNSDHDGWVSFEELKKAAEEPQPGKSGQTSPTAPPMEKNSPDPQKTEAKNDENLYPILSPEIPDNVRDALDKMLSMGFTNERNWLTSLLLAKNGNIEQVLEVLSFVKNN